MSKISDKILGCMAATAEEAFLEAMGPRVPAHDFYVMFYPES